jgi:para-nitrobenzyl esterase
MQGKFANGPVVGLSYSTAAGLNGTTDISGAFSYRESSSETVTFKVGSVSLGSAVGAAYITPLDLVAGAAVTDARVLNRVQLLQTLDNDKDIDNGIVIDQALAAKLNDSVKPDEIDGTKFEAALKSALAATPVNRALARESFESSLP